MTCPSLLVFIKKKKAYSQVLQEDNVLKFSLYCISPPFFFCSGTGPVAYPCPLSRVFIYEAFFVYYELMKRKLLKPIYECRCNERLQTKRFTRLAHTGSVVEQEHLKIKIQELGRKKKGSKEHSFKPPCAMQHPHYGTYNNYQR
jgi:hypothetical protein